LDCLRRSDADAAVTAARRHLDYIAEAIAKPY
jgi:DNA-binding FadR family transcriptional regulator